MSPLPDDARILLVRLSALGDCLHALPLLAAMRRALPGATFGWAIQSAGYELLRGHPDVDRFHLFPRGEGLGWPRALLAFREELRRERYHAVVDVQGLFKSGLAAWLSGAPLRVGFRGVSSREGNSLFINRGIEPASSHVVDRSLELLAGLEIEPPPKIEWPMPSYDFDDSLKSFMEDSGLVPGEYVVVNPGTTWVTKHWPAESFAELAVKLLDRVQRPILLTWGTESERWLCEVIRNQAPECVAAPPTSLRELAALISGARLVVANDTGPLHLAVALGVRTVALHGATDSSRTGPYGATHVAIEREPRLPCQPCNAKVCSRGDLACLRDLPVDRVLDHCLAQLAQRPIVRSDCGRD